MPLIRDLEDSVMLYWRRCCADGRQVLASIGFISFSYTQAGCWVTETLDRRGWEAGQENCQHTNYPHNKVCGGDPGSASLDISQFQSPSSRRISRISRIF